jgi:redox-sensitive bicupin YhaK (pirin superfamily)
VGLPKRHEETAPSFAHTPCGDIPVVREAGCTVRVLIGELRGIRSPVATLMPTLYLDVDASAGSTFVLPGRLDDREVERAVYSVDHPIVVDGVDVEPHKLAVIDAGADARIEAPRGARCVVIGGEPLDGHRFMWWNFVSSRKERIEEAKLAWAAQKMGQVFGETEWIPLP